MVYKRSTLKYYNYPLLNTIICNIFRHKGVVLYALGVLNKIDFFTFNPKLFDSLLLTQNYLIFTFNPKTFYLYF
ncbi:hypothetical protein HanPSC8_Chr17g0749851 [Helianthus annuus]|nr:hypothetical protein HanPSC8_Chr17g0749851 [Helianthus annuus]